MITGYSIHNINNENVLFLYIDYGCEFGLDFNKHHRNNTMKDEIKKFIKNNNINFDGKKIALSFGGVVLAMLLMVENPSKVNEMDFVYVSDNIVHSEIVDIVTPPNLSDEVVDDLIEEDILEDNKQENSTIIDSSNQNIANKEENNEVNNNNSQNNSLNNNTQPPNNDITNDNQNQASNNATPPNTNNSNSNINNNNNNKVETPIVNDKKVTIYRTNGSVITLSLEEYLIGVVGAEMPASFSVEALKAQAVVARTYALKKIEKGEKLTDSVSTQSYKDNNELRALWGSSYNTYYQKIKTAVESTKDLAIYYQGNLIDAVYHSTSNGKTQDSIHVWGNDIPYLKSVDSSWDKEATSYFREVSKDFSNVLNLLGLDINSDTSFEILSRDSSGRVLEIRVGNKIFSGVEFRNLLGLRSADFDLNLDNNNLIITTRGYGHGVGLSQYGASGMAKSGYTYEQILKHYYTGVSIY